MNALKVTNLSYFTSQRNKMTLLKRQKTKFILLLTCIVSFHLLLWNRVQYTEDNVLPVKTEIMVRNYAGSMIATNITSKLGTVGDSISVADYTGSNMTMTLISELQDTEHVWPWGGEILMSRCRRNNWYELGKLPSVSVIITFIDKEELVTLVRTIHSIVQRTPTDLLKEIILVEDNCLKDEFHELLDIYSSSVFKNKVQILRNEETLGLIRARLLGIRKAIGTVVVSMDSHMEVQECWLQPLLYEIQKNRKTLASSTLDWFEKVGTRWRYRHGGNTWKTYFGLDFVFGFQALSPLEESKRDEMDPIPSPVTVGTIWAMEKRYFEEVGEFDSGMKLWGGENLDLPIRIWLMGGRVVNVPCSHAAHLEKEGYRDYREKWKDTIHYNYKRVVEVWFDDNFKEDFYRFFPHLKDVEVGDLSERLKLKNLAQYDMKWFSKNVFPELGWPSLDNLAVGTVKNRDFDRCFCGWGAIRLCPCNENDTTQIYFWTKNHELRQPVYAYSIQDLSQNPGQSGYALTQQEYISNYQMNSTTKWLHAKGGPITAVGYSHNTCLQAGSADVLLVQANCDFTLPKNQWIFSNYTRDYIELISNTNLSQNDFMYNEIKRLLQTV